MNKTQRVVGLLLDDEDEAQVEIAVQFKGKWIRKTFPSQKALEAWLLKNEGDIGEVRYRP